MKRNRTYISLIAIFVFSAGLVIANQKMSGNISSSIVSTDGQFQVVSRVGASIVGMTGNSSMVLNSGTRDINRTENMVTNVENLLSMEMLAIDNGAPANAPAVFKLFEDYPNPFNPTTIIRFDIPEASSVTIKIYDIRGQEVATLLNHRQSPPGSYEVEFDARHLSSGIYLYRINAGPYQSVKKMMLLR